MFLVWRLDLQWIHCCTSNQAKNRARGSAWFSQMNLAKKHMRHQPPLSLCRSLRSAACHYRQGRAAPNVVAGFECKRFQHAVDLIELFSGHRGEARDQVAGEAIVEDVTERLSRRCSGCTLQCRHRRCILLGPVLLLIKFVSMKKSDYSVF
jgi:hypothetical protein